MQKKIVIIFYLLIYQSVSFAEDNYWEKLLHLKNNKTHIISENFYISELNDLTAEKELLLSINYINSTKGKILFVIFQLDIYILEKIIQ